MNVIKELWHGNIIPQENSRTNSKEMKELLGYMARHHEDLEKTFTDEQKEIFEKLHDCWDEYRKPCRSSHLRIRLPPRSKAHNRGAKGHIIGE